MFNFLSKFIFVVYIFLVMQAQAGPLKWAADTESGAPFVFFEAKNLKMTGFEFDLVQALSKKMNQQPQFVQNAWDGLILGLNNNLYDMAINGIEITDERKKSVFFTEPYYATYLSITVRAGDIRFKKLSDLSGFKVGTLTGALSEKVLRAESGIQVVTYESESLAHQDLAIGRLDAVLFDAPIAKYYSEVDSRFTVLPAVIGSMTYGIAVSKKNPELLKRLNQALQDLIDSGDLKLIYEKWGLWNQSTAQLFNDFSPTRRAPTEYEKYKQSLNKDRTLNERLQIYWKSGGLFLNAFVQTLKISFVAMLGAVLFGLILVLMKTQKIKFIRYAAQIFVELIRGTPLLLQLFFIFYALPSIGLEVSAFWAAVIGLALNYSVQEAEIYHSGLKSIHPLQLDSAHVLGFNRWQTLFLIEIPQAFRFCLGPMTTDFLALIKDSSLVSVITLVELTKTYSVLSGTYYDYVGFAVITAMLYLLAGMPLVILSKWLDVKSNIYKIS